VLPQSPNPLAGLGKGPRETGQEKGSKGQGKEIKEVREGSRSTFLNVLMPLSTESQGLWDYVSDTSVNAEEA